MDNNYEQPQYVEKRVRFFSGQVVFAQDSIDEQKYHIDRQRRHSRTLHISGICDGLTVRAEGKAISVDAGTALDQKGRLIVLSQKQKISVPDKNAEVKLVIVYQELESDQSTEGTHGNTRWHEQPKLEILPKETVPQDGICLATLKIKSNGEVEVDNTVRPYSGVYLPAGDGKGVTLRTHGDENSALAILDGSLSISGTLAVKGESTLTGNVNANGSLKVTGTAQLDSILTVNGNTNLQKDLSVNGNINASGNIKITGKIECSEIKGNLNFTRHLLATYNKQNIKLKKTKVRFEANTDGILFCNIIIKTGEEGVQASVQVNLADSENMLYMASTNVTVPKITNEDPNNNTNSLCVPFSKGDNYTIQPEIIKGDVEINCYWFAMGG